MVRSQVVRENIRKVDPLAQAVASEPALLDTLMLVGPIVSTWLQNDKYRAPMYMNTFMIGVHKEVAVKTNAIDDKYKGLKLHYCTSSSTKDMNSRLSASALQHSQPKYSPRMQHDDGYLHQFCPALRFGCWKQIVDAEPSCDHDVAKMGVYSPDRSCHSICQSDWLVCVYGVSSSK